MGHASIGQTADTYGHVQPDRHEAAAAGLDRYLAWVEPPHATRRHHRTVVTPKCVILRMVEGKGFEPSASGVRFQRSPGLS